MDLWSQAFFGYFHPPLAGGRRGLMLCLFHWSRSVRVSLHLSGPTWRRQAPPAVCARPRPRASLPADKFCSMGAAAFAGLPRLPPATSLLSEGEGAHSSPPSRRQPVSPPSRIHRPGAEAGSLPDSARQPTPPVGSAHWLMTRSSRCRLPPPGPPPALQRRQYYNIQGGKVKKRLFLSLVICPSPAQMR